VSLLGFIYIVGAIIALVAVTSIGIIIPMKRKPSNLQNPPTKTIGDDILHGEPNLNLKTTNNDDNQEAYPIKSSYIFISHIENDSAVAFEIAKGIEKAGYETWYHERDSLPGPSYLVQTSQAIIKSQAVVVIISQAAMSSTQMTKEVVRAHEAGKPFIPVLYGISHFDFKRRQPEWAEALGAAASVLIPTEGTASVIPRIVAGLRELGIEKQK